MASDFKVVSSALVVSVGWIVLGLSVGLAALLPRQILAATLALVLFSLAMLPLCASQARLGFAGAAATGIAIIVFTAAGFALSVPPTNLLLQVIGPLVWMIVQIPVVLFSLRALARLKVKV